jgi:hypothetical protein
LMFSQPKPNATNLPSWTVLNNMTRISKPPYTVQKTEAVNSTKKSWYFGGVVRIFVTFLDSQMRLHNFWTLTHFQHTFLSTETKAAHKPLFAKDHVVTRQVCIILSITCKKYKTDLQNGSGRQKKTDRKKDGHTERETYAGNTRLLLTMTITHWTLVEDDQSDEDDMTRAIRTATTMKTLLLRKNNDTECQWCCCLHLSLTVFIHSEKNWGKTKDSLSHTRDTGRTL